MAQVEAEVAVKRERRQSVLMNVRIRPNTPVRETDGDEVPCERACSMSDSQQGETALLMLDSTDHFANVGSVLVNSPTIALHMAALVEGSTVDCEAPQNVDAIVHVLHQTLEEGLLGLKQCVRLLWRFPVTRTRLWHNCPQEADNSGNALRNYCNRGVVGTEGAPKSKLTVP